MAVYLILLMVGGTSIKVNSVIYEDSTKGRLGKSFLISSNLSSLGLANIDSRESINSQVQVHGLNIVLTVLLAMTVCGVALQIFFFTIIQKCFTLLRQKAVKPNGADVNNHRV
jgi:hypothetical protein